jgi:hypothetical protein
MVLVKLIRFVLYYSWLLLTVAAGIRKTVHPLGIRWRWRHWRK